MTEHIGVIINNNFKNINDFSEGVRTPLDPISHTALKFTAP